MVNNDSGKFRSSWMFDTHPANYYLDNKGDIIGIECSKIQDSVIGVQTGTSVEGYIGNPGVFVLSQSSDTEINAILKELTVTYSQRIKSWLGENGKERIQDAA